MKLKLFFKMFAPEPPMTGISILNFLINDGEWLADGEDNAVLSCKCQISVIIYCVIPIYSIK